MGTIVSGSRHLDATIVRSQIDQLRLAHPAAWEEGDEALADALALNTDMEPFLGMLVNRAQTAAAYASGLDGLISELQMRQERHRHRAEVLRELAFKILTWADVKTVSLPQATLTIRAGQPKVVITDESALPEDCFRVKREVDKLAIRARLQRGEPVPGAMLNNPEPVLGVRIK